MSKAASHKRAHAASAGKRKSFFERINVPVTVITAIIGAYFSIRGCAKEGQAAAYLETNGAVLTHAIGTRGVGAVSQALYVAPLSRVQHSLAKQRQGHRTNPADEQVLADADASFRRGDYGQAKALYRQAAVKFPAVTEIRINLSVTLQLTADFAEASRVLASTQSSGTVTDSATAAAVAANLAEAYAAQDSGRLAITAVRRALGANATDPVAWNARGVLAYSRGDYRDAAISFRHAAAIKGSLPAHTTNLASALVDGGQPEQAKKLIQDFETEHGSSAESQGVLGRIYLREGDYAAARIALLQALTLQPGRADLNFNSALAYAGYSPDSSREFHRIATREDPTLASVPYAGSGARPAVTPATVHIAPVVPPTPTESGTGTVLADAARATQIQATGPARKRFVRGDPVVSLSIRPRPGLPGPAAMKSTLDAASVFGSRDQAVAFRDCSLTYGNVLIGAEGDVQRTNDLEVHTGNRAFEQSVSRWLHQYRLASSSQPYEAVVDVAVYLTQ